MKVKTQIKAGGLSINHNEALLRATVQTKAVPAKPRCTGLKIKINIKAGGLSINHNETGVRAGR